MEDGGAPTIVGVEVGVKEYLWMVLVMQGFEEKEYLGWNMGRKGMLRMNDMKESCLWKAEKGGWILYDVKEWCNRKVQNKFERKHHFEHVGDWAINCVLF